MSLLERPHDGGTIAPFEGAVGDRRVALDAFISPFSSIDTRGIYLFDRGSETLMDGQPLGDRGIGPGSLYLSANDAFLVFASRQPLIPGPNAPVKNHAVFWIEVATGDLAQVTMSPDVETLDPRVSLDDDLVAYTSFGDPVPGGNPDHSTELFLTQLSTGVISQLSDFSGGFVKGPQMSGDGSRFAFAFQSVDLGMLPELWFVDRSAGMSTLVTSELSKLGFHGKVALDGSGRWIGFVSGADLVPGENPDGNDEVFLYDTQAETFTQVTHTTTGGSSNVILSADGRRIGFETTSELVAGDSFLVGDVPSGPFMPVTPPGFELFDVSMSADGSAVVLSSLFELTDQPHLGFGGVYLVDCGVETVLDIPTLDSRALMLLALLLAAAGWLVSRRRRLTR
ncbi:MAG: IPTL-CTERM sorting domain-containing protein [Acidobacteria bacterium]|nr:IPTL-CTERM sorting domain-containing protein [Acidobacteriota bacterium]